MSGRVGSGRTRQGSTQTTDSIGAGLWDLNRLLGFRNAILTARLSLPTVPAMGPDNQGCSSSHCTACQAEAIHLSKGTAGKDRAGAQGKRPRALPGAEKGQLTLTSICLGRAFSLLGRWTRRTPSLNSARTFSGSASSGMVKLRSNRP